MKVGILVFLAVLGLSSGGYVRTKLPSTRLQQKLQQQTAAPEAPAPQQPATLTIKVHTYGSPAPAEKSVEEEQPPAAEEHNYEAPAAPQEKQPAEDDYHQPEVEVKAPVRNYDYVRHRDGFSTPPKVTKTQRKPSQPQPQPQEQAPGQEEHEQTSLMDEIEDQRAVQEANKNAKYNFATAVDDGIMDQSQVRQETRDGLKVSGSYKYSDGFVRRIVTYEADENGYRVVSEHTEPIGEGPQIDMVNGKADIHTMVHGVDTQYSVNADEISYHSKFTTTTTTTTTEAPIVPVRKPVKAVRIQSPVVSPSFQNQRAHQQKLPYYNHEPEDAIKEVEESEM